jgi:hypothetical protein
MNEAEKYLKGLNDYLDQEIENTKEQIIERAKSFYEYVAISDYNEDDLFDIDMDKGVVSNYDYEEKENHAYDLGVLKTLEDIKRKVSSHV